MIDYGIPGDCLKLRRQTFWELMTPDEDTGYMDGEDYGLLKPYVEDKEPNLETKLWLAFLYGLSYSVTTTIRFAEEFGNISDTSFKKLKSFWEHNKNTLHFAPDKRYLKNNDQVVPAIMTMKDHVNGDLKKYLIPLLKTGFDNTYKQITKNWRFFGPEGAYLFFDVIYGILPEWYSEPEVLDWRNSGKTVVEGMAHFLGEDEVISSNEHNYVRYNKAVDKIVTKTKAPKIVVESNLCFFRKLFKGSRYLGYYADRQLEECYKTAELLKHRYNINIWDYRERTVPEQFRGEINGWQGIRKERCKIFLTTGTLMGV